MIATVSSAAAEEAEDDAKGGGGGGGGGGEAKTRMWAIWTRNYGADGASDPEKNTLYILRLVIDDDNNSTGTSSPDRRKALQLAFDAVMQSALDAARPWSCGTVHLWNPTPVVQELIAASAIAHKFVDRELDSIPSMMWYGATAADDDDGDDDKEEKEPVVDWIANEKYCWC
ncbi:hypothetical protein CIB48_g4596 [Xylaria polymorpha]|nr:hypothetical protein CIB48_g4596 [Xylaria polymorpha]